ncbi:MAG: homoserine kinase [candidate division KSB1 bacterium]|nr:homoserine kinase [candidate division KSB1 bacterium]MDZ7275608.1 homoserine kinase [candidate division KSB1 bacterium]MDZ7284701.1 homoserine kinase [candidate division KSB1 bacterium]MDZ7297880.1 homoserine kinase [candidate division KSB1 bacterium]MDZ7305992.1 homoserine kinase [candidate division KSB1 bacterium]
MTKTIHVHVKGSTSNLGAGFDTLGLAVVLPLHVICHVAGDHSGVLSARGEGAAEIAAAPDNLIVRAFAFACRKLQQPAPPLALEIDNHIPLRRGLGSSGAAIIAGLLAAEAYFGNPFGSSGILNLACELEGHPENAAASLLGGMTVTGVDQGGVRCARFAPPPGWVAACFVPVREVATEAARRVLPTAVRRQEAVANLQSAALMVAAFAQHRPDLLRLAARDTLHQPYRKPLIPAFDEITTAAQQAGAFCSFLSGSGSTILALCEDGAAERVVTAMAAAAQALEVAGRPLLLQLAADGAVVEIS